MIYNDKLVDMLLVYRECNHNFADASKVYTQRFY